MVITQLVLSTVRKGWAVYTVTIPPPPTPFPYTHTQKKF